MKSRQSWKKRLLKHAFFSLLKATAYISLLLLVLSALETILIYPPKHSYNIGPPFFWTMLMSPILFFIAFLGYLVLEPLLNRVVKKLTHAQKLVALTSISTLSFSSSLWLTLTFIDLYRNVNLLEFSNHRFLFSTAPYTALVSPAIINSLLFHLLRSRVKISQRKFTAILLVLAASSITLWWFLMRYWKIGYY